MIVITVRFPVKPEYADTFLDELREATEAVRNEPGCLWYDWPVTPTTRTSSC